jgi:acetyl-CoA synthetase
LHNKVYKVSPELVTKLQNQAKITLLKYPIIVEFVKEIPKTISGKIKRKGIRETGKIVNLLF